MFPKINPNQQKGREGEIRFADFVTNTLKCIFHKIDGSDDFGLDGHIELVIDNIVTGKYIAVQIKHGDSYLTNTTPAGFKYIANDKYLNYYLNSLTPVFIVVMSNDFSQMHWVKFDPEKILPYGNDSWWIEIPKSNTLLENFKDELVLSVGPIIDYSDVMHDIKARNKAIHESDYIIMGVSKDEIINLDFSNVFATFEIFSQNSVFRNKFKSSFALFFPCYDNDPREIFAIPEVMNWIRESFNHDIPWSYFMRMSSKSGISLIFHAFATSFDSTLQKGGYYIEYDNEDIVNFMNIMFDNLNKYTEKYGIDIEINKEISYKLYDFFFKPEDTLQ